MILLQDTDLTFICTKIMISNFKKKVNQNIQNVYYLIFWFWITW